MEEERFDTVTAAETGTPENRDDVERAAEIVAGLGDTGPLRSVAAVIVGFVVLTLGSVLASRLIGLAAAGGGTTGASAAGGSPAGGSAPPALEAGLVWANLASRLLVAVLAGAVTARAAPRRPHVHALALAAFVTLISVASLLGLRAAGQFGDPAWYPLAMLFVGPAGILLGGRLRRGSSGLSRP